MTDLKNNKSFRVLVGAFCLYIAFRLWRDGWFSSYSDSDGYGNAELVLAVGAMVINFLELVGIAAIAIVSGVLPELSKIADWFSQQSKQFVTKFKAGSDKEDPAFDWRPLIAIVLLYLVISSGRLNGLLDSIKSLIGIDNRPVSTSSVIFYLDDDATNEQLLMANSAAVAGIFADANIERRLYYSDQSVEQAEPWVTNSIRESNIASSKLLISGPDGRVTVRDIPTTVQQYEALTNN